MTTEICYYDRHRMRIYKAQTTTYPRKGEIVSLYVDEDSDDRSNFAVEEVIHVPEEERIEIVISEHS